MRSRTHLIKATMVGVVAALGLISAATAVFAYPGIPAAGTVTANTCGSVAPGTTCSITVRFVSAEGQPIVGASVSWTVSVPPGGSVSPNPSTTDANGQTTITYSAPSGTASAPGEAVLADFEVGATTSCGSGTVTGTTGGVSVSVPVNVACAGGTSSGLLPQASTGSPTSSESAMPRVALGAVAAIALLIVVGSAARLRRRSGRLTV